MLKDTDAFGVAEITAARSFGRSRHGCNPHCRPNLWGKLQPDMGASPYVFYALIEGSSSCSSKPLVAAI